MKLIKGLNRDSNPVNQPEGSWRDAENIVLNASGNLTIEEVRSHYYTQFFDDLCGIIPLDKDFIIFGSTFDDGVLTSYIYKISLTDNDIAIGTKILATTLYNFDKNYPIRGEYRYNYQGEVIIMWYSDWDVPRIFNIDDPGIELDSNKDFVDQTDVIHTQLFPISDVPEYTLVGVIDNGGELVSGVYQLTIQYKLIDDSYTNFHPLSNPIFVNPFSNKDDWYNIHAYEPGTQTSKYINFGITNLDTRYEIFRLGIVYKVAGVTKAYIGQEYTILNSSTIGLHSIIELEEIPIAEMLVGTSSFKRIGASTVIQNTLYVSDLEAYEDLSYQQYACNIKVEPVYTESVTMLDYKQSYKDEVVLFDKKGLMLNEVYALYIRFVRKIDGKFSQAFTIPGRERLTILVKDTGGDTTLEYETDYESTDNLEGDKYLNIYEYAKLFHFRDTSDGGDRLAYWENKDEIYPYDDEYNGKEVDAANGIDLREQLVRHHKMPSFYSYMESAGDINADKPITFESSSVESIDEHTIVMRNPQSYKSPSVFDVLETDIGEFRHRNEFHNTTTKKLIGRVRYTLTVVQTTGISQLRASIYHIHANGDTPTKIAYRQFRFRITVKDAIGYDIELEPNDSIVVFMGIGSGLPYDVICIGIVKLKITSSIESTSSLNGKILGLKISNIQIPDDIRNNYSHYEILYAKRQVSDMTVIGQGLITSATDEDYSSPPTTLDDNKRFYSFDALHNKIALGITHMSYMYQFSKVSLGGQLSSPPSPMGDDLIIPEDDVTKVTIVETYPITKSKYVPADFGHATPENENRDEFIALYFNSNSSDDMPPIKERLQVDGVGGNEDSGMTVIAINSFKPNVYKSFLNKELVRTGALYSTDRTDDGSDPPDPSDIYNISIQYGFDTVFTTYGVSTFTDYQEPVDPKDHVDLLLYYLLAVYSVSNIGYRYKDEYTLEQYFFPKVGFISIGFEGLKWFGGKSNKDEGSLWEKVAAITETDGLSKIPEYYGYDNDLNSVNDLSAVIIYNPDNEFITKFTSRIHRSVPQGKETLIQNWRIFKVNEYYDSVYNKGPVYNLDTDGRDLLIQHTSAMFVTKHLTELKFADGVVAALGQADIFQTLPQELIPTTEGYVGCQSRYASFRSKAGNLVVDREQGKIFLYNAGIVEEISANGLKYWFQQRLQYESEDNPIGNMSIDNPYAEFGITAAYDDKYNRILVAKNFTNVVSKINYSWTLSYYPSIKAWLSFHSYTPKLVFNTRVGTFTYDLEQLDEDTFELQFRKLNGNHTDQVEYDRLHECRIDVVFNTPQVVNKRYLSIIWNTIVTDKEKRTYYDRTFTKIVVYNYNRHSSLIELTNYIFPTSSTSNVGNMRNTGGVWKFNEFRDLLKTKTVVTMDEFDIEELQFEAIPAGDKQTDWTAQSMFLDNFIVVRFIFQDEDRFIQINNVDANSQVVAR